MPTTHTGYSARQAYVLVLLTLFPQLTLWLPNLVFGS